MSFDLQLLACPTLEVTQQGANLVFLWPDWAGNWELKSSGNMLTWSAVAGTPAPNGSGQLQLTLPLGTSPRYFRLELP